MGAPVTDHAVIRYLERCKGFDIEAVRTHIWKVCEGAAKAGATCIRAEGVKFEFASGRVITVTPDGTEPSKTSKKLTGQRTVRPCA